MRVSESFGKLGDVRRFYAQNSGCDLRESSIREIGNHRKIGARGLAFDAERERDDIGLRMQRRILDTRGVFGDEHASRANGTDERVAMRDVIGPKARCDIEHGAREKAGIGGVVVGFDTRAFEFDRRIEHREIV